MRAQKVATPSYSLGSIFIPRHLEDRLEIKMLKESLKQRNKEMRQWDEAIRQWDNFYAQTLAQQQTILHVSSLNYFIRY
jgi:hypothetical protein